jgi:L-fuconolactonase
MRLDSHQHFWEYDPAQYPWITDRLARIRRSFLPADLEPELKSAGLDGCIAVQARQTIEETRWLLELSDRHSIIKGVVGWVDLRADNVEEDLEQGGPRTTCYESKARRRASRRARRTG